MTMSFRNNEGWHFTDSSYSWHHFHEFSLSLLLFPVLLDFSCFILCHPLPLPLQYFLQSSESWLTLFRDIILH